MIHSEQTAIYNSIIDEIENSGKKRNSEKIRAYFDLFQIILEEATLEEGIHFTTLFSRLAYAGTKFQLDRQSLYYCHLFRKLNEKSSDDKNDESKILLLARYSIQILMFGIYKNSVNLPRIKAGDLDDYFRPPDRKIISFKALTEALVIGINEKEKEVYFIDEDDPAIEKTAMYDVADKNELFTKNIENLRNDFKLPISVNFIHSEITEDEKYIPGAFIIHPDFLIDVTAIAECFQPEGASPYLYLVSRFKPHEVSTSLATGNIVNYMLDELINHPDTEFDAILSNIFKTNPIVLTVFSDDEVKQLVNDVRKHFYHLKHTINEDFEKLNIHRKDIFLEPSFFSRDYGIQGRLDLLHFDTKNKHIDIVELKSGKAFRPNIYGISAAHYVQTLLYDLLIQSAYKSGIKPACYILYSKEEERSLRFAPQIRAQQFEAMKVRNQIVIIEQKLKQIHQNDTLLQFISLDNFPALKGFAGKSIEWFHNIFNTLSPFEKHYIKNFIAFIAREQALAKTGEHGFNKSSGHASLWLESLPEKEERFAILYDLSIIDNQSGTKEPTISFSRPENKRKLSAFRKGDIVILYPDTKEGRPVLHNQIFKCNLLHIDETSVVVKLRSIQHNQHLFEMHQYWMIEEDSLDSSFHAMHRSLFTFASADVTFRSLFLGLNAPDANIKNVSIPKYKLLTDEQQSILEATIQARGYYLIWGPPGTGKTSVVLRTLVEYLFNETEEQILLLAYTNRAVDEICDAVISIDSLFFDHFVRIGSRFATSAAYQHVLLDQLASTLKGRHQVIELINNKRIFISTVSSIMGRNELFLLKSFDTVIIDEASQIPEPMLAGLLSRFKKFVLIGDHKQLPAVVRQSQSQRNIIQPELIEAGFTDTGMSLFERMYLQCQKNGWIHNYGILSQQGRMHKHLLYFPNQHFYANQLTSLSTLARLTTDRNWKCLNTMHEVLTNQRMIYIHTSTNSDLNWKTNSDEAEKAAGIVQQLYSLFQLNQLEFKENTIGIITPYRAQISRIRKELDIIVPELSAAITVDTVERYQGSARDIIILSLCTNKLSQMEAMVSLSQEGTDRKLNVALTRAKEQIIILGNEPILKTNLVYANLLDTCYSLDSKLI